MPNYNSLGFPGGSDGKESACNAGDLGLIPRLGRSPGGGHGNPLHYSFLEDPHGQRSLVGCSPWGRRVGHDCRTQHMYYPRQSTDSVQSLSNYQWHLFIELEKKKIENLSENTKTPNSHCLFFPQYANSIS